MPVNKTAAAIAVAGLVLATFAAAAVLLGVPRIQLHDDPTAADEVTLYQSGLAFVGLQRTFGVTGGQALLAFAVPTTTIFDSLRVDGGARVEVRELRSTLAEDPVLEVGDRVVVHVDGEAYRGTLLALTQAQATLSRDAGGFVVLDLGKAQAVEVEGRAVQQSRPGTAEVTALVSAPAGNHTVRITYLARGPGWQAVHKMDAATGDFRFEAMLTGLEDWENVTLDLVAGAPNVVFKASIGPPATPPAAAPPFSADQAGLGFGAGRESFAPGVALGDLHRYRLERPVDLARGETVRLPVIGGKVDLLRHFYHVEASTGWGGATGDRQLAPVLERQEIRNALDEPLQPGVVRFYRNDTWIGDDNLPAIPRGDRANLTLAASQEVKARVVLERFTSTGFKDTFGYALVVENLKREPVDLRAALSHGTFRTTVLSVEPPADETLGGKVIWDDTLAAGASITYRLSYEVSRTN